MPRAARPAPIVRSAEEANALAVANVRLIWHVVTWLRNTRPGVLRLLGGEEEAFGWGAIALVRAAQRWRPEEARFSTVAVLYVRRAIVQASERCSCRLADAVPFSTMGFFDDESPWEPAARREGLDAGIEAEELQAALQTLSPRHRRAVELRFLEGRKLMEVGQALGVSKERARQLARRGLERLRERLVVETASP